MVIAHPLSRFPVFLMGVLGGLQVLRAHGAWDKFQDPHLEKNLVYVIIPWGSTDKQYCSKMIERERKFKAMSKEKFAKVWKKRVDFSAFLYTGVLTALIVTLVFLNVMYDGGTNRYTYRSK